MVQFPGPTGTNWRPPLNFVEFLVELFQSHQVYRKTIFFEIFFFEKKLRKRRIVPKNENGDPLGFINILSVAKYQKIRKGDSFETLKIFEKKFAQCRKKLKGGTL